MSGVLDSAGDRARGAGHAPAAILRSEAQAIAEARRVADALRPLALDRAREHAPPVEQLDALFASGVPAIAVPAEHGGLGASLETIVETVRLISHADAGIGQVLQLHNVMVSGVLTAGDAAMQA